MYTLGSVSELGWDRLVAARMALGCSSSAYETLECVWEKVRKLKASLVLMKFLTSGCLQHAEY